MAQVNDVSTAKAVNQAQFGDPATAKGTSPEQTVENPPPEQTASGETERVESETGRKIDVTA